MVHLLGTSVLQFAGLHHRAFGQRAVVSINLQYGFMESQKPSKKSILQPFRNKGGGLDCAKTQDST